MVCLNFKNEFHWFILFYTKEILDCVIEKKINPEQITKKETEDRD